MKIELFDEDGQTDRHDEADSRFSQFCEKRLRKARKEIEKGPNAMG